MIFSELWDIFHLLCVCFMCMVSCELDYGCQGEAASHRGHKSQPTTAIEKINCSETSCCYKAEMTLKQLSFKTLGHTLLVLKIC